ncbi:right-handed parallel beta-helix repeat-containing protein [Parabacteroides sp. FAFU027]|uniref:right-handed parallel beta-helix repeat-containing protein n=1 Tax=Parabacteroides sp. FAFU027 TaxID=2922715 RepID=UPI001FAECB21|nr:T9SS type A sorting domain-containing protein [Parabacteroides sp. FAFU027]
MKRFISFLSFLLLISLSGISARNYYVATNGNDTTGTGAISAPYATIMKAQQYVVAGDTVFVRGGTYKMTEAQIYKEESIWAYTHYLDKSGTSATSRICYFAYPGEQPVFDLSNVKPSGYRNTIFYTKGSWLHIKGLEVIGVQVTITTHTQSECFRNEGSNNIFEQLKMHDGMGIGFYLTKGANNLILNCDAYRNYDSVSESGAGGNTDGFGLHPAKGGTGNVIRGCRAWFNSDDGYDCINSAESVTFDNCWAFYNGYDASFVKHGDGNGFKAGGYGQAPAISSLPSPIPSNTIKNCLAYRNKANGFYANHHVVTGSKWNNNTAYRNSTNYNMLSQRLTKSPTTGADTTIDCPGINHILHNNISFKYSTLKDTVNLGTSVNTFNTFSPGIAVVVDANDFVSLDESLLIAPRQADGSLPNNGFLRLKTGSDLIDKGTNVGYPFVGIAPDLGAFEYQSTNTAVSEVQKEKKVAFYPNPAQTAINFGNNSFRHLSIYDLSGKRLVDTPYMPSVDVSSLNKGCYLVKIEREEGSSLIEKMIKE